MIIFSYNIEVQVLWKYINFFFLSLQKHMWQILRGTIRDTCMLKKYLAKKKKKGNSRLSIILSLDKRSVGLGHKNYGKPNVCACSAGCGHTRVACQGQYRAIYVVMHTHTRTHKKKVKGSVCATVSISARIPSWRDKKKKKKKKLLRVEQRRLARFVLRNSFVQIPRRSSNKSRSMRGQLIQSRLLLLRHIIDRRINT